jgi:hypothetical protein
VSYGPLELQKAIYQALDNDLDLRSMIGLNRIFDTVPQAQVFPFITIGEADVTPFDSHTQNGFEGTFNVHVWTRHSSLGARGRAQTHEIMGEVYRIIHGASLTVTGFRVIVLRYDFSNIVEQTDGLTYHGVTRFKFMMGEI